MVKEQFSDSFFSPKKNHSKMMKSKKSNLKNMINNSNILINGKKMEDLS